MKLKRETVQEQIYRLSIRFKGNNYTSAQLELLTGEYFVDLVGKDVSEDSFEYAIKEGRTEWERFPTVKQIIDKSREYKPEPVQQIEEMPFFKTEEQLAKNKEKVAGIIKMMNKKMGKVPKVTEAETEDERHRF